MPNRTASRCCRSTPSTGASAESTSPACNKDFSCVEGFCPSFVTVEGATPRRGGARTEVPAGLAALPEPKRPPLDDGRPFSILVAGVGGTGVVTIGALVNMAAHLEGIAFSTVDQFGMAQKGGAVTSHGAHRSAPRRPAGHPTQHRRG